MSALKLAPEPISAASEASDVFDDQNLSLPWYQRKTVAIRLLIVQILISIAKTILMQIVGHRAFDRHFDWAISELGMYRCLTETLWLDLKNMKRGRDAVL